MITGTSFAVWAPNARAVRVAGDFNYWDSQAYPMRSLGSSGVWELFIPDVASGDAVQAQRARGRRAVAREGRPDGVCHRSPPAQGSVVFTSTHVWQDAEWLAKRAPTVTPCARR